ncbi:MAG: peptidase M15 [bacterium]|nr:peptidase M15 [bacterium]
MNRRAFLKAIPLGLTAAAGARYWVGGANPAGALRYWLDSALRSPPRPPVVDPVTDEGAAPRVSRLEKTKDFDRAYEDDFLVEEARFQTLLSVVARIGRTQQLVGHGNFNLLSFDQMLSFAGNFPEIGEFPRAELDYREGLFFADATRYGFFGEKVIHDLTSAIPRKDVVKIAGSGHYLLKGEPVDKFRRIRKDIGDSITLTSGVRGLVKQYQLFLAKAVVTNGNLSQASRSLAPPGYSFHARGDFDLGKVGFGLDNFTESFCETDEYRKLIDLGYVGIRYTPKNPFGVRHEPWHIKIA